MNLFILFGPGLASYLFCSQEDIYYPYICDVFLLHSPFSLYSEINNSLARFHRATELNFYRQVKILRMGMTS